MLSSPQLMVVAGGMFASSQLMLVPAADRRQQACDGNSLNPKPLRSYATNLGAAAMQSGGSALCLGQSLRLLRLVLWVELPDASEMSDGKRVVACRSSKLQGVCDFSMDGIVALPRQCTLEMHTPLLNVQHCCIRLYIHFHMLHYRR